ncbi:MAG: cystathionine gamma-synthase [Acidobacteria bacterium RIFCSPLOWO2_12_FULL_54_10]|nr:MAG: cystathionine gamma-synthase [Acidobacteria bacterium RIFCSPLOWO2_12_FULL_54_10]
MGFATDAIHAGQEPDPSTGAVAVPIYQSSTYVQEELGKHKGYEYSRTGNPTRAALERNMAVLEGGKAALAFASGMAATNAVMTLLKSGDHVVCSEGAYGGTPRLFNSILKNFGLDFTYVDTTNPANLINAIQPNTRMVFVESPTNPLMKITDLSAISAITRSRGLSLVVDNTFLSPFFQKPISLGADIVVHSTTKYLNGHSDGVGGVAVLAQEEDAARLKFIQNAAGAILGPFDSWLVLRGIKTLAVRMKQHETNAIAIAKYLVGQPKVKKVNYPGLEDHPQHALASRQMTGFGGMMSFDTGSLENARRFLNRVKLCSLGESLGGVETLICHPATMTHAYFSEEERQRLGISQGLVRLSVGIEDADDIVTDLEMGLSAIPG